MKKELQIIEKLNPEERKEFGRLIKIVRAGVNAFMEAGKALTEIREKKLYREGFTTFEEFCKTEFKMTKTHANRLIGAFDVLEGLKRKGVTALPDRERIARELTVIPEEQREAVWKRAVELAGDIKPQSKHVREAILDVLPPEGRTHAEELELIGILRKAERNVQTAHEIYAHTQEVDASSEGQKIALELLQSIWRTVTSLKRTASERTKPEPKQEEAP